MTVRAKKGSLLMRTWRHAPQEGSDERAMQTRSAQRDLQDRCALRLPRQQSNAKGNQMQMQSDIIELSGAKMPKDCEAAMKEEDDFMIRHGWYMSCFYQQWRKGRGRAVEKKRAAERAKYMKLYENSTTCPRPNIVGVNHPF
jgi:hypothetical protein